MYSNMRCVVYIVIVTLWSMGMSLADEISDRKAAAMGLMKAYKNAEALAAFTSLAEMKLGEGEKSEVLENAAYCALRLRHSDPKMIPKAIELANQIPLKEVSVKCRMLILMETGQSGELIRQFKDEDISGFPKDIAGEVLYMRGAAYALSKKGKEPDKGKEAEADFKMALERSALNEKYLMAMASNYYNNLKDEQKAIDTYQIIIESSKPPQRGVGAALEVARIRINSAKYDEALKALENFKDLAQLKEYYRVPVLRAFGQAYAGLGKEEEAMAKFNEANKLAGRK